MGHPSNRDSSRNPRHEKPQCPAEDGGGPFGTQTGAPWPKDLIFAVIFQPASTKTNLEMNGKT